MSIELATHARRKPLRGVAYNFGHIFRLAKKTKRDTLTINFVTGQAGPP